MPQLAYHQLDHNGVVEKSHAVERAEEVLLRDHPIQACVLGYAAVAIIAVYAGL